MSAYCSISMFAVAPALLVTLWGTRILLGEQGVATEYLVLFAFLTPPVYTYTFEALATSAYLSWLFWCSALSLCLIFVRRIWNIYNSSENASSSSLNSSPRPYICPCRTTHTRFFPKSHSFSYSYLQVAIPIGWTGTTGSLLSVDLDATQTLNQRHNSPGLFGRLLTISGADHLDRSNPTVGLHEKLRLYLLSQDEDLSTYTSAWLLTAPRFLGYTFNPVSFWYLYRDDVLAAMILEVNNTFDERRMYFMKADAVLSGEAKKFTSHWPKDFHVSPFNSRKGTYSLSAQDPLFTPPHLAVDSTITLSSSKAHAKLVARIFATGTALDPARMSPRAKLRFVAGWFWVGFMTFPRIAKEAGMLFFRRRLHVWHRPEVLKGSIGRKPTSREAGIAEAFPPYLLHVVSESPLKRPVSFTPAAGTSGPPGPCVVSPPDLHPSRKQSAKDGLAPIDLHILTPAFYAAFALAPDPAIYLTSTLALPLESRTFATSDPTALVALFSPPEEPLSERRTPLTPAWAVLAVLRNRRKEGRMHPMDRFVYSSGQGREGYRKAVTGMLLASWVSFGSVTLLDFALLALRGWFIWWSLAALVKMAAGEGGREWIWGSMHLFLVGEECLAYEGDDEVYKEISRHGMRLLGH